MAPPREEVFKKLEENRERIKRFNVRKLGLFGSTARGEQRSDSDLYLLVEMDIKDVRSDMFLNINSLDLLIY